MTKEVFISELRARLSALPKKELEERIDFYIEMIDDRIEEGLSEAGAVSKIGSVDEIASQIISEIPLSKIAKERIKQKRTPNAWEIIFLVLTSPIWLSLLAAAFAVFFALYISFWAIIAAIWTVFASLLFCVIGAVIAGLIFIIRGLSPVGIPLIGAGLVCSGLSILAVFACKAATKGILKLSGLIVLALKKLFIKKEGK